MNSPTVFSEKSGKQIGRADVAERRKANVSFGGKAHRALFLTASGGFYSIQMRVRGANAAK
jgi:gluconolactonase